MHSNPLRNFCGSSGSCGSLCISFGSQVSLFCSCITYYFVFRTCCNLANRDLEENLLIFFFMLYQNFSPHLTWRDMQHLTVLTSKRNSLFDSKGRFHWTMNGVGLEFNHLFGFGVLGKFTLHILGSDHLTM